MENSAVIKSAHEGTALEFFDYAADYYKVSVRGFSFHGAERVYVYEPFDLATFFHDLAAHWRGWQGKKEWSSLEGELALSATSDSTGHVSLSVRLRSETYPFGWCVSTTLLIEAGQLESIASQVEEFLRHG